MLLPQNVATSKELMSASSKRLVSSGSYIHIAPPTTAVVLFITISGNIGGRITFCLPWITSGCNFYWILNSWTNQAFRFSDDMNFVTFGVLWKTDFCNRFLRRCLYDHNVHTLLFKKSSIKLQIRKAAWENLQPLAYIFSEPKSTPEWNMEGVAVKGDVILLSQQSRARPLPSAGYSQRQMQILIFCC